MRSLTLKGQKMKLPLATNSSFSPHSWATSMGRVQAFTIYERLLTLVCESLGKLIKIIATIRSNDCFDNSLVSLGQQGIFKISK